MNKILLGFSVSLFTVSAWSEVWQKPPYLPDENHLPKEEVLIREAQEEKLDKENKKEIKETPEFQQIEDEMNERTESGQ